VAADNAGPRQRSTRSCARTKREGEGEDGEHLGPARGDEDQVLQSDAAVADAVEPGLERDHVALDERLALDATDAGSLVHLETDAVTGRMEVAVDERLALLLVQLRLVAVLVEEVAHHPVDVAALHTGLDRGHGHVQRLLREPVVLTQLVGRRAERERSREVRVAGRLAIAREEVEEDDVVGGDRARAALVADGCLHTVRDDDLVGSGAVLAERALDLEFDPLAGERLAVAHQRTVRSLRTA
jgi:hypothetical protein